MVRGAKIGGYRDVWKIPLQNPSNTPEENTLIIIIYSNLQQDLIKFLAALRFLL